MKKEVLKKALVHILIFLTLVTVGFSQDETPIRFQHLGIQEGLSQSSVFDVVQDHYGFVWIATQDGLNKYDGKNITTFYHAQFDSNTILSNTINCLLVDEKRDLLWVGTERGLNTIDFKSNKISSLLFGNHKYGAIEAIVKDSIGNIWINAKNKGVVKYTDDGVKTVIKSNPTSIIIYKNELIASFNNQSFSIDIQTDSVITKREYKNLLYVAESKFGVFYLSNNSILFSYKHKTPIDLVKRFKLLENKTFTKILVDGNHCWIGTEQHGLFHYDIQANNVENYQYKENIKYTISDNYIRSIYKDYAGTIWIGTDNGGISFFDFTKQNIKYLGKGDNGLSSKIVWAIEGDEYGNVFIGTNTGLDIYNQFKQTISNYTINDGKSSTVRSVIAKDQLLVGTDESFYKVNINGSKLLFIDLFKGIKDSLLQDIAIYTITPYKKNEYWLGTSKGLIRFDTKNKSYTCFNRKTSNISNEVVRAIYKSEKGDWWIGTEGGLNRMFVVNDTVSTFSSFLPGNNPNTISGSIVTTIIEDDSNFIWVGTYDGALNRYNPVNRTFKNYSVKDGLSNNAVYGILKTDSLLWVSTNRGISSLNLNTKEFRNFYESDGLQSNEFNTGAFYKTKYGELFFGGINGVSNFYPTDLKKNKQSPLMGLTKILVNNKPLNTLSNYENKSLNGIEVVEFNYTQNNINIHFASLHYTNTQNNKYRYFIRELQDTSLIIDKIGVANYSALSPGEYNLVVYGSNSDGVWSEQPLTLKIIIHPPFWGTWLFRIFVIGLIGLIVFFIIRFRIRSVKKSKALLESLVKRRTETIFKQKEQIEKQNKDLEKEKEKADNVLHKIFPDKIAQKLKNKGKVKAEHYQQATIMFADFVSFSSISSKLKPEETVSQLNRYFKEFDKIIIRNNLVQIKTIGDSYMTAAGIPKSNNTNAIDSVLAGLQIQSYMQNLYEEDNTNWRLRVGINTGELVAGVLETKRPLYDIWGSSVNIASRVQDEGKPGKVNISEHTYRIIKPFFNCSARGGIMTKNVGVISMYFVDGIRSELSQDGEGKFPNRRFWSYVKTYLESELRYNELEHDFIKYLRDNLDKNLHYHSLHHTIDVIDAAERIALAEGVFDERMLLIKTAALIHDAGFIKQYNNNEPVGVEYAKEWLPKYGYSAKQIDKVSELILATNVSHKPKNKLQRIIKDADLDYLGRDDFESISDKLFMELQERGIVETKEEWDKMQVKFFNTHQFYTAYSKDRRAKKKELNKPFLANV